VTLWSYHYQPSIIADMPNQTFFNLPDKKRQKITDLAILEFAHADYDTASISNIVKQAKIAKGSFYQYFADKKELYLYVVNLAYDQRIAFIRENHPTPEPRDFFESLRWLFHVSVQFNLQQPLLTQVINRAAYGDSPVKKILLARAQATARQYIQDLVQKGMAQGDLIPTIDPDLATFIIVTASDNLKYYIPQKLGVETQKIAEDADFELNMQAIDHIFDQLVQVFKRGMGQR